MPPPTLVVLVHGLFGKGYKTWGQLPQRLFDGTDGPAVDVAVYDYRNGFRGILRRIGKWEYWTRQLSGHIRQIEAEYSDIVLVGHSLGGILIEAITKSYLEIRALRHEEGAGPLAALFVISSPRAGSGWAAPPLVLIMPELFMLRRLGSRSAEVDEFFASYTERHNIAAASPGRTVVPVYAALGGGDKLVSQFSAAFSVPSEQRLYLDAGHRSIVKPGPADDQLIDWILQKIAERLEVRAQAARQEQHYTRHALTTTTDPRAAIVTRFVSDSSGLLWEEFYNEARRVATTTTVTVRDIREVPDANVDLLIAVHNAVLVVAPDSGIRTTVLNVRDEQDRESSMSVGICPVGDKFREAEVIVRGWIAERPPSASFYVSGAADAAGLRGILARLLQLVIGRDPHRAVRAALADPGSDEPSDLYDPKGGGF